VGQKSPEDEGSQSCNVKKGPPSLEFGVANPNSWRQTPGAGVTEARKNMDDRSAPAMAGEILKRCNIPLGADFYLLSREQFERLLAEADQQGYERSGTTDLLLFHAELQDSTAEVVQ
jgi:hypothetical protein